MSPALMAQGLSVAWRKGEWVLRDLDLELAAGELLGIIGPSGCGKSTLCLALAGIIPRQLGAQVEGRVTLDGQNLGELGLGKIAGKLGIVFQDPETQLFLPKVRNELAFGPENLCLPREEICRRLEEVAAQVGCEEYLWAHPWELSGGEQQLVALAAVLALEPQVLILDEVSAQLDEDSRCRLLAVVETQLAKGTAVLMVEHNLSQLVTAHRVLVMRCGGLEVATREDLGGGGSDGVH